MISSWNSFAAPCELFVGVLGVSSAGPQGIPLPNQAYFIINRQNFLTMGDDGFKEGIPRLLPRSG